MSRIKGAFEKLAKNGEGAYIPYVCAGDPDKDFTVSLACKLLDAGADILELGIPFSDPVADGPVIQGAMQRSLEGGFKVNDIFGMVESLRREGYEQPIVLMTYSNPVLRIGIREFCSKASQSGADAILMVDMPLEESRELDTDAEKHELDVIRMVSPSTTNRRMDEIISRSSGFIYAVSVAGVTGMRSNLSESAKSLLGRVVRVSSLPVVLGFGISSPAHVADAMQMGAKGVVEGSGLVSVYASVVGDRRRALAGAVEHVAKMKVATYLAGAPLPRDG